jgi:hypothetical protein
MKTMIWRRWKMTWLTSPRGKDKTTITGCDSVVPQLSPSDQENIQELLDLRVTGLGVGQDLANKIDRALHLESVPYLLPLYG